MVFASKQAADENDEEQGYSLLGFTGVEDLLQDNVKETVTSMLDAGINVWMLTGDKGSTA